MRYVLYVLTMIALAGCGAPQTPSTDASGTNRAREAVAYVPEGPPKLTLFTVINNKTGSGGHTGLLISGREQIMFDPAGSFRHEDMVERGDVLYGMSPGWVKAYKSAHARSTYHVVTQEITVSPAQAEQALQLAKANGSVAGAFCTNATSSLLRKIPGFESVQVTFFPRNLMEQIAQRSDVRTDRYYEDDAGDVVDGIVAFQG